MKMGPAPLARAVNTPVTPQQPDPLKQQVLCPVLGALVKDGSLHPDAQGNVKLSDLSKALRSIGASIPATAMLTAAAPGANAPGDVLHNLMNLSFNVFKLRGGLIQHAGDTHILTSGKFDEQKFQALISHSQDGKTMTLADLAGAGLDSAHRDGLQKTHPLEYAELGAAIGAFGYVDKQGTRRVDLSTLRNLFQNQQLPPDQGTQGTVGLANLTSIMAQMAFSVPSSATGLVMKGMQDAVGKPGAALGGNLQGLKLAMCPAMQGAGMKTAAPNGRDELAALHQPASA